MQNQNIRILTIALTVSGLFSSFLLFKKFKTAQNPARFTIGILQTASHPALDAAKLGFTTKLKELLGHEINFITQNAQGSVANMHGLAQQLQANPQISGFFAIATPAAQAIAALEKTRPIFITAVTDPHSLGLIHSTTNVCGATDLINVSKTIELITQLVPQAKTIGLLYTSGEPNSIFLAQKMRQALQAKNLQVLDFTVTSDTDIAAMTELACRKTDLILCPTDHTVAATISLISTITDKYKKPLIVSDNLLVAQGALAAQGVDYQNSGAQAAQIAYDVLVNQQKPADLPIEQASSDTIYLNQKVLKHLSLEIPKTFTNQIRLV